MNHGVNTNQRRFLFPGYEVHIKVIRDEHIKVIKHLVMFIYIT